MTYVEVGSFVYGRSVNKWNPEFVISVHGMAREVVKPVNERYPGVFVETHDVGVPHRLYVSECIGDGAPNKIFDLSTGDYMRHLEDCGIEMGKKMKAGGLAGSVWGSRMHHLIGVMTNIDLGLDPSEPFAEPETGVYAVHGVSHRLHANMVNPSTAALEGVRCEPRLSPQELASYLGRNYPYRFGSIDTFNAFAAETGRPITVGYHAYEIPREAVPFVKDPAVFELPDDYDRHLLHVQEREGSGTHI